MPTETIVNRVHQDPFLQADLEEAGLTNSEPQTADAINRTKTGRIDIPVPFPFPPPTEAELIAKELKEAGVEVEDDQQKAEPSLQQLAQGIINKRLDLMTSPAAPRDPDLREFKKQVIAAFKHLGLDTVKFFGI